MASFTVVERRLRAGSVVETALSRTLSRQGRLEHLAFALREHDSDKRFPTLGVASCMGKSSRDPALEWGLPTAKVGATDVRHKSPRYV